MPSKKTSNRREQIHEAAQNKFREKGYIATSMRDLAQEVGIEAASLYNHIKSKEEILQNICFDIAKQFLVVMQKVEQNDLPPSEKLQQAITLHIQVISNNLAAAAVFVHEWRFLSQPYLSQFKNQRDQYENSFRNIIQQGIDAGVFKTINPKVYCLALLSSLNGIYEWYHPEGELNPKELSEHFCQFLLKGIIVE